MDSTRTAFTDTAHDTLEVLTGGFLTKKVIFKAIDFATQRATLVELDEAACITLIQLLLKHFENTTLTDDSTRVIKAY